MTPDPIEAAARAFHAASGFHGDRGWLSNFSAYPALLDGVRYPTAEHAYQAAKTHDLVARERLLASTPRDAKRLGRLLLLRPDWETAKVGVMREVVATKFALTPWLVGQLVATGGEPLVEVNHWHDQFWGDCRCPRHVDVPGRNELGHVLMSLRRYYGGGA